MKLENLKKGDLVRSKLFKDKLRVEHVVDEKIVNCVWFTDSGKLCRSAFNVEMLEPFPPGEEVG